MFYDFYRTGSDDQVTLDDNQLAYRRIKLRPKILIDVSSHSPSDSVNRHTKLLNSSVTISFPCIIAPTALHRLANREHGELATIRAAVTHSTIMCVSTGASTSMESIAEEHQRQIKEYYPQSHSQLWYQLYVYSNRQRTQQLIQRAERSGYKAIVITVDVCILGNRECDIHNNMALPDGIRAENLIDDTNDDPFNRPYDSSLSWRDLEWIRSITRLPLIIKGILHPDDAREAVRHGVQGIVVSNHGGRQLDTSQSTIEALSDIIRVVRSEEKNYEMDVYVDGGIRRGTDILKAVALGAKAVMVGRPILWGLAVDGEKGVSNVLQILKTEFQTAMMLCGCQTIEDISKNDILVMNSNNNKSKL
ncbi:unnamed protein product [Rotaria sordida]|uniref:(S)-2-hydroxy-acid oxidase n=2 Tax=Rotaria sordida TaxID=392033 RepID=A0A814X9S2_9BILA|nr:unnamed protein product [Rotaria sordida]CAF3948582.1 unnamed protein product [Rotaria sordida]CAF3973179.1 unnamed protein product [Rotaria sordida]